MTPEGKVKSQVNKLLDRPGVYRFMPVPSGYGEMTVDYLCCIGGLFVGIETKAPGKKPTGRQENVLRRIRDAGGFTFVIDGAPEQLAELQAFVDHNLQSYPRD